MALIKTTAFLDTISGSIRGSVFAHNKGGAYVRGKGLVANPQTQKQSAVRSVFASIAQAWRVLTAEERSAWNAAVSDYPYQNRIGETKMLSGFGLHQKLNLNLLSAGKNPISAPLAPASVAGLDSLIAVVDVGAGDAITVQGSATTAFDTDTEYIVYATPSVSAGVSNVNKLYRKLKTVAGTGINGIGNPTDVKTEYIATFGAPSEGETVGFKVVPVNINTGQSGTEIKVLTTVVST